MPIAQQKLTANCNISRIVQGEALTLLVEIFDSISGQVLDLTDLDTATAQLPGTDTTVELTGVSAGEDGRLAFPMTAFDSAALKVAESQSWQVKMTFTGGTVRIVQLLERLDVEASLA
jgi:hypothetical protein